MSNNQKDILSNTLQRFAISALSKERKNEAVNEEILVGKYTGEFFIKTKDGVVISTDVLNRLKTSTESAIRCAESTGIGGSVFKIDFDNLALPSHIDYSTNILGSEFIEVPNGSKNLLLNIDFDEYDILDNTAKPVTTNASVNVSITVENNHGSSQVINVNKSLKSINYHIIDINVENARSIKINSIVIEKDDTVYNIGSTDRAIILHNLFVSINE